MSAQKLSTFTSFMANANLSLHPEALYFFPQGFDSLHIVTYNNI